MIRAILVYTSILLFFIFSIPALLIEWILDKISPKARQNSSRVIVHHAFRICLWLSGAKIQTTGVENIPKDKACLFVANHNSIYDVLASYIVIQKDMGFIAKIETKKIPCISIWMKHINCLFLDRKDIKQGLKIVLKAIDYINEGISIFVFPEGTRSKDGKMIPFKEGSLKMGEKTNCPIVPVAITGTAAVYEDDFPRIHSGVITIDFGTPFTASELEKEERKFLGAYTQKQIQAMLDKRNNETNK